MINWIVYYVGFCLLHFTKSLASERSRGITFTFYNPFALISCSGLNPNLSFTGWLLTIRRMAVCFVPGDARAQIGFWLGWVTLTQHATTTPHPNPTKQRPLRGCARE